MLKRPVVVLILGIEMFANGSVVSANPLNEGILMGKGMRLAGLTEQEKKELFLKAREDLIPVSTPVVTPSIQSPTKKEEYPSKKSSGSPIKKPQAMPSADTKQSTKKKKYRKPSSSPSPKSKQTTSSIGKGSPPRASSPPTRVNAFLKKSEQQGEDTSIHIVKSGHQNDEGWTPVSQRRGLFASRYRYLTRTVRRAIDRTPVKRGRWKYVIIHNSGTRQGNARVFDVYHRRIRHMQNGLAYHFVIGNGHSSGNGQIEVGRRWYRQINGGHVASDYLNNIALGICLVGDFNRDLPTPQQLAALEELISYLRSRVGRFRGHSAVVLGHREINPKPTDCPGGKFPLRWLHRKFPNR